MTTPRWRRRRAIISKNSSVRLPIPSLLDGVRSLLNGILVDDPSKANGNTNGATPGLSNGDIDHDDSEDEKDDEGRAGEAGPPGGGFFHIPVLGLLFTKAS